jgi:hypothetical protein
MTASPPQPLSRRYPPAIPPGPVRSAPPRRPGGHRRGRPARGGAPPPPRPPGARSWSTLLQQAAALRRPPRAHSRPPDLPPDRLGGRRPHPDQAAAGPGGIAAPLRPFRPRRGRPGGAGRPIEIERQAGVHQEMPNLAQGLAVRPKARGAGPPQGRHGFLGGGIERIGPHRRPAPTARRRLADGSAPPGKPKATCRARSTRRVRPGWATRVGPGRGSGEETAEEPLPLRAWGVRAGVLGDGPLGFQRGEAARAAEIGAQATETGIRAGVPLAYHLRTTCARCAGSASLSSGLPSAFPPRIGGNVR